MKQYTTLAKVYVKTARETLYQLLPDYYLYADLILILVIIVNTTNCLLFILFYNN